MQDQQKIAKNAPSGHHRTTLSDDIFATKACIDNRKKLLNSNTSSTCPVNTVNFGPLAAEICWRVWGTPVNFNGFRVLAALLHGTLVVGVSKLCGVEQRAPPIIIIIDTFIKRHKCLGYRGAGGDVNQAD